MIVHTPRDTAKALHNPRCNGRAKKLAEPETLPKVTLKRVETSRQIIDNHHATGIPRQVEAVITSSEQQARWRMHLLEGFNLLGCRLALHSCRVRPNAGPMPTWHENEALLIADDR